jgi:hypothetical protein
VAVVVVRADADDPDLRVHGGQERRRRIGGAVMRNLQHVRAKIRAVVDE